MSIETLGQAYNARWKVSVTCDGCDIRGERVDLRALLWTRGTAMPIEQLPGRLKCPRCGSRTVKVMWTAPGGAKPTSKDLVAVKDRYWVEQLDMRGEVVEVLKRDRFDAAVRIWEQQVKRHPAARVVMRDGTRVVREWPERGT
jgi:hypothetical protein